MMNPTAKVPTYKKTTRFVIARSNATKQSQKMGLLRGVYTEHFGFLSRGSVNVTAMTVETSKQA